MRMRVILMGEQVVLLFAAMVFDTEIDMISV